MIILKLSHPIVRLVRHVCSDKAQFAVVTDTVWARELASSNNKLINELQINIFLQSPRVRTMRLTHTSAGNLHNYSFPVCKWQYHYWVFLCWAVTTRRDEFCRSSFATCMSSGPMTVVVRDLWKHFNGCHIVIQRDYTSKERFYCFQDFSW